MKDGNDLTDDELHLPDQIRSILRFHVYFTTRRILNEMGVPMPGDPIFKQSNNGYNVTAYKSICAEFGIYPNSDFRFTAGNNKGLGSVYIWLRGARKTDYEYQEILNSQTKMEKQVMESLSNIYLILIQQNNTSTLLLINALV